MPSRFLEAINGLSVLQSVYSLFVCLFLCLIRRFGRNVFPISPTFRISFIFRNFKMFVKKKNNGFFNQCDYTFEGGANMIFSRGRLLQRLIHSKEHNWMFFSQPVPSSYHEEISCTIATRTLRPFFLNSLMTVSTKSLLFLVHKPARGYFLLTL